MGGVSLVFVGWKESFTMVAADPDPAIKSFLALLDRGIATGQQVSSLPLELTAAMLAAIQQPVVLGEDIEGDLAM